MKAAISVELGGTRFALDERALRALRSYLDRAAARLGSHPDRDEVIAGLERSIAAKLAQRAGGHRGTIDEAAMLAALGDVGRVDGPGLDGSDAARSDAGPASGARSGPRRLYRLRDGAKISGVCAGLGAYAEIDANLVRVLFVLGAVFSAGLVLALYLVLMFVLPVADSAADVAAGHGDPRNTA
jgi:phage shock protein PspC (stress-responsive transcriptional regulator)